VVEGARPARPTLSRPSCDYCPIQLGKEGPPGSSPAFAPQSGASRRQTEPFGLTPDRRQAQALSQRVEGLTFPRECPTLSETILCGLICEKVNEGREECNDEEW
jgi:hypothetical protein